MKKENQTMYENEARTFVSAIVEISSKPENLYNLECYLSRNFGEWLKKWANVPEDMAGEMSDFARMKI